MANQQNPLNQNSAPQAIALAQALQDAIKAQGDYNNLIKNAIKDLNATIKSYEKIEAKLATINRSAINIKEIEDQTKKAVEDRYKNDKKLAEFEVTMSKRKKQEAESFLRQSDKVQALEKEIAIAKLSGSALTVRNKQAELAVAESMLDRYTRVLNTEQLSYAQAVKNKQLDDEVENGLKKQLALEKDIRKQVGYTGAAMKLMGDNLGIGEKAYARMAEKARKLAEENEKTGGNKKLGMGSKISALAGATKEGLTEAITDPLTMLPMIGTAIGGVVKGVKQLFDFMLGIEDATVKFGRAMNLSREAAKELKMHYASINISNGNLFVNTQKLMESQTEMVQMLGVTNRLSDEILSANIELKDIAGVEAETRKGLAVTATITGKTMKETTKSVLAQVVGLKNATGIQFEYKEILKEATSLGGYLGLQFAKYPAQLAKSLVTVKAMGMEIKQLDGMADSFLDFESSISKEFEAQLLTGKEINLNKARELFLNNDLAGAAAEITSQVGSSADFMKMNRIQADSFAQAFGMSRDQLGDMLKQQEQYAAFGAKNTKELQAQVMMYKQQGKEKEAIAKLGSEEAYQSMINASMQEKIAAFMDKIKQSIADFVEKSGLIDVVQRAMDWLSEPKNIRAALMTVRDVFANIMDIVASVASGIIGALNFFGAISDQKESELKGFLEGAGDKVRSLGGDMAFVGTNVSENATKKDVGATNSQGGGASSTKFAAAPQTIIVHNQMNMDGQAMTTSMNNANNRNAGLKGDGSQLFSPSK